ncbi:VOC domain-containing protein [Nitrospira tepida]|uniref:2-oxoadipate dioxygenase/decarboxylase n=1 Tax=Nitrospira tepida TaxID=2973512 RepID=A0AA86N2N0_9BACT|nr:VOC family protein [Nitrospira tepida]CAI4033610.1 VOC domain-containing protein [Nitrospira tepida]
MRDGVKLDALIEPMVADYVAKNRAAQAIKADLDSIAVGLLPVIDHLTIRTDDIDRRAQEFVDLGYEYAETIEYSDWYAKVYRAPGYPALFVDQAYADDRGKTSVIPRWVAKFGDRVFHHLAVRVEDIDKSIARLKAKGVRFAGEIVGAPGSALRQIFTVPESVDGEPFSVLELTERHAGYQGFSPPQADGLMRSTVLQP